MSRPSFGFFETRLQGPILTAPFSAVTAVPPYCSHRRSLSPSFPAGLMSDIHMEQQQE